MHLSYMIHIFHCIPYQSINIGICLFPTFQIEMQLSKNIFTGLVDVLSIFEKV